MFSFFKTISDKSSFGSIAVRVVRIRQPRSSSCRFRPGDLLGEIHQHRAEMVAVAQQACGAGRPSEQKREDVLVGFLDVAGRAGEDKVVAPVVRCLPAARRNVIQSDSLHADAPPAISAHGAVPVEEPLPRIGVRVPAGWQRRVLMYGTRGAFARPLGSATGAQRRLGWGKGLGIYELKDSRAWKSDVPYC